MISTSGLSLKRCPGSDKKLLLRIPATSWQLMVSEVELNSPRGRNMFAVNGQRVERAPTKINFYADTFPLWMPEGFTLEEATYNENGTHPALTFTCRGQLNGEPAVYSFELQLYGESRNQL